MSNVLNDDISDCITTMSSLNLTVENEMFLSYTQRKNAVSSHGDARLTHPNATVTTRRQHADTSQERSEGSCSVLIEAPPSKALSLLFRNQTCSRVNQVRVRDNHDGWSTTLNGCSPWMSPGYDVTTANRSATMVIDLDNTADFYKLEVHIKAVAVQLTDKFTIRYVSPVLGYIQTPGWHPFTRPFNDTAAGTATVRVPLNRTTLISVVFAYLCLGCTSRVRLLGLSQGRLRTEGVLKRTKCIARVKLLTDFSEFRVEFSDVYGSFLFSGVRLLFSFHQPLLAPRRYRNRLWNCSVPSWPDFQLHFVCNARADCVGRKDERWCPDTSCQQGGFLLNEICYVFISLKNKKKTWNHANTACRQVGANMASFPTVYSWYHYAVLSQRRKEEDIIYIGLQSPDANHLHMYRYSFQWYNGSIGHYSWIHLNFAPPNCVYLQWNLAFAADCAVGQRYRTYALCQATSSPGSSVLATDTVKYSQKSTKETQSRSASNWQERYPFPSILCPDQHRTHAFLASDVFSACCHNYDVSSSDVNATSDIPVRSACAGVDATSSDVLFRCQDGASYVPYSVVCNHFQDCPDNSDEDFCIFPLCSGSSHYKCANGQCLQIHHHCDDVVQCIDESDEIDCVATDYKFGTFVDRLRPPVIANFDGHGWMIYTQLTTDWHKRAVVCPDTHVFCPGDGYCLPVYVRCNGLHDCPALEDEVGCDSYTCPGFYRCRGLLNTCLHPNHLCDGWPQCPQHDDEAFCNLTCPVSCACLGHAFTCSSDFHVEQFSSIRYLDAGGTGLESERLGHNTMLVNLSLANCNLTYLGNLTLPNLVSLDLSDNRISAITVAELKPMNNLQNLYLARNPLWKLFSGNFSSRNVMQKNILHIDLSGVNLKVLDIPSHFPFPNLVGLNMSQSGVTRLIGDGFQSLRSLRILDLRGCSMNWFPRRLFEGLTNLRLVFADNYKLCCEANLPEDFNVDNCEAPFDEVSSCDALLRADVYRVCLSVLAALALSGNLGCFCLRIFSLRGRSGKNSFNVFVTHLCVSDFVMGLYMAMIGVADRLYLKRYLWEDDRWRHSPTCQVAGVLALLSSEVSAFIICLITLDRFLVIRFPFSQIRFSSFTAHLASFLIWTVCIVLVTVPLSPVTAYKQFYGQTGICIPLPITRNDFDGHIYAFGVMIALNFVVFLMIAAGQISVYFAMRSNVMNSVDKTRKSRDITVARRLITVVVSDFLCWFPLGLLGILATQGISVPGEVNVAMAIFVLPLNSALNPFLYTLNIIREKRQRATDAKLLKIILDLGIKDNENASK